MHHTNQPNLYKRFNNFNYCWAHGFDVPDNHTSQTCPNPKYGHNWYATRMNTMGGIQLGAHKTLFHPMPNAYWQTGAGIRNINKLNNEFCKNTSPCTPPTSTDYAITDSGCTGHFLLIHSPTTNKRKATNPLHICMPDGHIIQSSHTCQLNLSMLPKNARKGHITPSLAIYALLSIAVLCDNGCEVKFTPIKCIISCNNNILLEGIRDNNTNL